MRFLTPALSALLLLTGIAVAAPAVAEPSTPDTTAPAPSTPATVKPETATPETATSDAGGAPDLSGFRTIPADGFVDNLVAQGEAYFQTPDGLLCGIRPAHGSAGCDGRLPGTRAGVNEIVLAAGVTDRGLRATANPQFVKPSGSAAPVLPEGAKIVYQDFECAVGAGPVTLCTKASPDGALQWLKISEDHTGIGPATAGLPGGFPDPNDFVVGDDTYVVGSGPKNMFPVFTVPSGLTCAIVMYSGGEIGCDGKLPGVSGGENEIFAQLPGPVGIRRTDDPRFDTPAYPGNIRELPTGYRVSGLDATCMSTEGGVACFGTIAGNTQGFEVSPEGTSTFGGQPS